MKLKDRYVVIDGIPTIRQVRNGKPVPYLSEIQPDIDALEKSLREFHASRNKKPDVHVTFNGHDLEDLGY